MAAKTPYPGNGKNIDPGIRITAVTKSDTAELNARGLYVGTGGDLVITTVEGNDVTFKNVASGSWLPIYAYRVKAATTAADIVALDLIP